MVGMAFYFSCASLSLILGFHSSINIINFVSAFSFFIILHYSFSSELVLLFSVSFSIFPSTPITPPLHFPITPRVSICFCMLRVYTYSNFILASISPLANLFPLPYSDLPPSPYLFMKPCARAHTHTNNTEPRYITLEPHQQTLSSPLFAY